MAEHDPPISVGFLTLASSGLLSRPVNHRAAIEIQNNKSNLFLCELAS